MNSNSFRVGVAQITSTDNIEANLSLIEKLYAQAAADLVVFPENTLFFRIRAGDKTTGVRMDGPELARLQRLVDGKPAALMVTTALLGTEGKVTNSTLLFEPGKPCRNLYSKVHLFDVDVAGAPPVRESDFFTAGSKPSVVELNGWKIGLSICYDLRFSELFSNYAQQVDLILVPSAFLVPTGTAHWEVLLRARAIETQCFVAAPAQSGEHRSGDQVRKTYGHSLAVDPWGKVLCELQESPEIRVVELQREALEKVRRQIPMGGHRRL